MLINSFYKGEWILFDYLAIVVSEDLEYRGHLEKTLWLKPVKIFISKGQEEVRIYDVKTYRERENQ